ncbi:MAG: hypothetical protein JW874_12860 [Spirochaetales bacterium]|nr:hypothetical protein [Spirochaetales bacterium]
MKPKRSNRAFLICLFSLATGMMAYAGETFEFRGDSSRMIKPRGKKEIILTGNASISSDTLVIRAQKIRRFGNDLQYTVCTGNVRAHDLDRDIEINCENLFFDTDADTMTIESWSELYDRKNDVVTKSGYMFDNRKDKITFLSINVRIFRDEVVCRSEFATFDHNTEKIELTGNPVVYKEGNEMSAFRIFYDVNTEELELIGNVAGTIEADEEDSDSTAETQPAENATQDIGKDSKDSEDEKKKKKKAEDMPPSSDSVNNMQIKTGEDGGE